VGAACSSPYTTNCRPVDQRRGGDVVARVEDLLTCEEAGLDLVEEEEAAVGEDAAVALREAGVRLLPVCFFMWRLREKRVLRVSIQPAPCIDTAWGPWCGTRGDIGRRMAHSGDVDGPPLHPHPWRGRRRRRWRRRMRRRRRTWRRRSRLRVDLSGMRTRHWRPLRLCCGRCGGGGVGAGVASSSPPPCGMARPGVAWPASVGILACIFLTCCCCSAWYWRAAASAAGRAAA